MKILIRLDDITPDMDMERFNRIRVILDKYNIKPLLGLVPDCRDENLHKFEADGDFWKLIDGLMASGYKIAQHGTFHVYETDDSGILGINPFSEFAGLSYDAQYEKLKTGRDILLSHGIHTDIFMAPGHTFDKNTVRALKALGFSVITDGLYPECYDYEGIVCVPCRLISYDKINLSASGLDTVCLHTNLMDEKAAEKFEDFLKEVLGSIGEFDVSAFLEAAVPCTEAVRREEARVLKARMNRDKAANNARVSWYLGYTNHKNSKIKWIKRALFLPLLLTDKYKEGN